VDTASGSGVVSSPLKEHTQHFDGSRLQQLGLCLETVTPKTLQHYQQHITSKEYQYKKVQPT
jgi:hypothetical protein